MSPLKIFTVILFSLTLALILQTSFGADPLFHLCSSSQNFTPNSFYESNLKTLINSLNYKTPPTGFGVFSGGQFRNQQTYGLALCRGDVSTSDCKTCVSEATKEIRSRCPYNKGAIIWYDYCLFKYLDTDFFGTIDNRSKIYTWNLNNVSTDPATFNNMDKALLSLLAYKASAGPKAYASGKLMIGESEKVYGLAQCPRGLTRMGCKKSFDYMIRELPMLFSMENKEEKLSAEVATSDTRFPDPATTNNLVGASCRRVPFTGDGVAITAINKQ